MANQSKKKTNPQVKIETDLDTELRNVTIPPSPTGVDELSEFNAILPNKYEKLELSIELAKEDIAVYERRLMEIKSDSDATIANLTAELNDLSIEDEDELKSVIAEIDEERLSLYDLQVPFRKLLDDAQDRLKNAEIELAATQKIISTEFNQINIEPDEFEHLTIDPAPPVINELNEPSGENRFNTLKELESSVEQAKIDVESIEKHFNEKKVEAQQTIAGLKGALDLLKDNYEQLNDESAREGLSTKIERKEDELQELMWVLISRQKSLRTGLDDAQNRLKEAENKLAEQKNLFATFEKVNLSNESNATLIEEVSEIIHDDVLSVDNVINKREEDIANLSDKISEKVKKMNDLSGQLIDLAHQQSVGNVQIKEIQTNLTMEMIGLEERLSKSYKLCEDKEAERKQLSNTLTKNKDVFEDSGVLMQALIVFGRTLYRAMGFETDNDKLDVKMSELDTEIGSLKNEYWLGRIQKDRTKNLCDQIQNITENPDVRATISFPRSLDEKFVSNRSDAFISQKNTFVQTINHVSGLLQNLFETKSEAMQVGSEIETIKKEIATMETKISTLKEERDNMLEFKEEVQVSQSRSRTVSMDSNESNYSVKSRESNMASDLSSAFTNLGKAFMGKLRDENRGLTAVPDSPVAEKHSSFKG